MSTPSASASASASAPHSPYSNLIGLIPPFRYGIVEEKLYRGAYPTLVNFRFLRRLRLRTIISLTPEQPSADLISFCDYHQINNIHIAVEKWNEAVTMTAAQVSSVVEHLIRPQLHPIYIHCLDGGNITGLVIMALRRLQCWTLPSIMSEHQRYTRDHSIDSSEKSFIKNFTHDIHVPETIPKWLWQGRRLARHKIININPTPTDTSMTDTTTESTADKQQDVIEKNDKKKQITTAEEQQWDEMLDLHRWGMKRTHVFYDALLCPMDQEQLYYEDSDEDEFLEPEYSDELQSLALEGCTMNPELPRPLQMFHSTNDPI